MLVTAAALLLGSSANAQFVRGRGPAAGGDPVPGLRGFSVVLVQGDLKTGATVETLPAAATKALADLKDFLPYKSYRLLDTQWTMGSGRMTGRLRGPEGKEYDLDLTAHPGPTSDAPVTVSRFMLREVGANAADDRFTRLFNQGLISQSTLRQNPGNSTLGIAALQGAHAVIDTTFGMNLGETVVVGTSRLQGDTALIVLLTAVAKDGVARGVR